MCWGHELTWRYINMFHEKLSGPIITPYIASLGTMVTMEFVDDGKKKAPSFTNFI